MSVKEICYARKVCFEIFLEHGLIFSMAISDKSLIIV